MQTNVNIGTLISSSPEIHGECPIIAGTGVTVRRITADYKVGLNAEQIVKEIPHLTLAQVYAALAYYHANQKEIEADLAFQEAESERLEAEYKAGKLL